MASAAANRADLGQKLTNAVLASISRDRYSVDPPKLSPELWDRVCVLTPGSVAENERLEFLGDALMDACFGIELYKRIPDGTPHMYTEIRSALHRNLSFCHLANHMGITTNGHTKSIGDVFETLMGAFYTEKGFDALYAWTRRAYEPIITAAIQAYDLACPGRRAEAVANGLPSASSSSNGSFHPPNRASTLPAGYKGKHRLSTTTAAEPPSRSDSSSEIRRNSANLSPGPLRGLDHSSSSSSSDSFEDLLRRPISESNRAAAAPANPATTPKPLNSPTRDIPLAAAPLSPASYPPRPNDDPPSVPRLARTVRTVEDIPLPPFWEEGRTDDGKVFFVDHSTATTTWDDPRLHLLNEQNRNDSDILSDWTARLMAPLPEIPNVSTNSQTRTHAQEFSSTLTLDGDMQDRATNLQTSQLFPELLEEGYYFADGAEHLSFSEDDVPEFCEIRTGRDGHSYVIDHTSATIVRKAPSGS